MNNHINKNKIPDKNCSKELVGTLGAISGSAGFIMFMAIILTIYLVFVGSTGYAIDGIWYTIIIVVIVSMIFVSVIFSFPIRKCHPNKLMIV